MANRLFSEMQTKVSNFFGDTDATFVSYIADWLNDKYQDAWRRMDWSITINNSYTFPSVASQTNYDLPADFGSELFLANITDGVPLTRYTEALWWAERHSAYQVGAIASTDIPDGYVILRSEVNSTHTGFGVVAIDPTPSSVKTYAMPYKRKWKKLINVSETCDTNTENKIIASAATFITDGVERGMVIKNTTDGTYGYVVTVDSETQITANWDICPDGNETVTIQNLVLIPDLDVALEYGAIAEGYAYKKQMQKSDYYLQKCENELRVRIGQERAQPNQSYQRIPAQTFGATRLIRLTGDNSYDSLT